MALTDKLTAIANAIRAKTGKSATMTLDEMPTEIASISGGGSATLITKTITANGSYDAEDDNADGYSSVTVNVAGGGSSVVVGTITPESNTRSLVISDIIGKNNVLIFPTTDNPATVSTRTHWGSLFFGGRCILVGSSNSSGSAYTYAGSWNPATSEAGVKDILDSTTGTITINGGAGSNYGGYFVSTITYRYIAW